MTAVRTVPVRGGVESLAWDGDDLVDLVGGGRRWAPDGTERDTPVRWGFPFDRAALSPSGRYAAVWAERGAVLAERPEAELPQKDLCFGVTHVPSPIAALSPDGTRLAVARPDAVAVIDLPPHP
ncbi:hypothetical protein [Kitasatospora cineracea]|uniref:hypothetical protein n=1 Tax=Kitasatospora cineracea TaxID=88074 RepID=UPI000F504C33|nr:hypothetical protein [Kitasatospora cineracea]